MDKEFNENNIRTLTALEAVRSRPALYFKPCFEEETLDILIFEGLCHAFDEYFDGNCDEIDLTIWKNSFKVRYNAGMPLGKKHDDLYYPESIMTRIYTCSNLKKHLAVGEEFCRVGISQINFGSESVQLTTVSDNQKGIFIFKNGETESIKVEAFDSEESWTELHIHPSKELFMNLEITSKGVQTKIKELESKLTGLKFNLINNIG
jgi:DNA gyrase/topoisomerase IV subunit B